MNNWNQLNNDHEEIWIRKINYSFIVLTFQLKFDKFNNIYKLSLINDTDRAFTIYTNQISQATYSANLIIQETLGNIYNEII
jgi:hypothetical protein